MQTQMISVPGTTRYEIVFDDRNFEELLEKYISLEAANYYRERIRELEEEHEYEIEELQERIEELEEQIDEQEDRE